MNLLVIYFKISHRKHNSKLAKSKTKRPLKSKALVSMEKIFLGDRPYDISQRALVMGILNRTPDSFFDGGKYFDLDDFLNQAETLVNNGADILDVGGVKAGPDEEVTEAEEIERVASSVEALSKRFDVAISVDTWRATVAKEAFSKGAVLGNDISGFADPDYLRFASAAGASVVACHMRLAPRYADPDPKYSDLMADVKDFLAERIVWAKEAGIPTEKIFIDVGLDFGKTYEMSAKMLFEMNYFTSLGHHMVLAASNKEFLGFLTGIERSKRGGVSMAASIIGIERGCKIIRVHDVAAGVAAADMMANMANISNQ